MSRRQLLGLGAGIAIGGTLGLSGCGGSSDSLRAMWWGDGALNAAVRKALARYQRTKGHPKITSEVVPFEGYWDKLATLTASHNTPDLVMQAASYLPEYAGRHAMLDLDKYRSGLDLDAFDPGVRDFGAVGRGLYGVVAATNAMGLIANTALLRRAGMSVPTGPWTWADQAGLAKALAGKLGGHTYGLQDSGGDLIMFDVFVRDRGRDLYDAQGKVAASRQDVADWFTYWDGLRKVGAVPPAATTAQAADITQSPLVGGKAVLGYGWTQDFVTYASSMKDPIAVSLPPWNDEHPSLWVNAASLWSASAYAKEPEKSVALIKFLTSDKAALSILGVALGVPPSAATRARLRPGATGVDRMSLDYMDLVTKHSRPLNRLWPKGFTALRDDFAQLNQAVGFGRSSVPAAVSSFFASARKGT